tara:strand:+ start:2007 stop:2798 length:792 start_codon:yes stop_codon:yes gene_type:complete
MPQTVHAWLEDADRSGSAANLAAVADTLITTSGDNLRLRQGMDKIAMAYFWTEFSNYPPVLCTISAPSIAQNPLRLTRGPALNFLNESQIYDFRNSPINRIRAGDDVTCSAYESDEAGVAHYTGCALIVSNTAIPIVPTHPINRIHRCTVGSATAGSWTTLPLTEQDPLPAGQYLMLGAKVESAAGFASRFIFRGMEERPAVIPTTLNTDLVHPFNRFWGKAIPFTLPDGLPKLEMLTAASETPSDVELYLFDPRLSAGKVSG